MKIPENDYKLLFKITDNGEFVLLTFDKVYKNYLVFIDVYNTKIWSKYLDYIVEVSFRDVDQKYIVSLADKVNPEESTESKNKT